MHSREEYIKAIESSNSLKEVIEQLYGVNSLQYRTYHKKIKEFNLETEHRALKERQKFSEIKPKTRSNEELFSLVEHRISSNILRKRILNQKLLCYNCALCGLPPLWRAVRLTLDLDHKDGNPCNNDLNNLRFLCPNCHSQTPTFKAKNVKKDDKESGVKKEVEKKKCLNCPELIRLRSTFCKHCSYLMRPNPTNLNEQKFHLTREELEKEFTEFTMNEISEKYNFSRSTIHFYLNRYGIKKQNLLDAKLPSIEEIKKLSLEFKTIAQLAHHFGISRKILVGYFQRINFKMNPKNKGNKPRFEVSKEDLEKLLKEKPCTEIGKMFGVSDNAIKKRAKKLGIVLQDMRGYWAKVYAGQTPELLDEHD